MPKKTQVSPSVPEKEIKTHRNEGKEKLAVGVVCAKCGQPLAEVENYSVHTYQRQGMPAPALDYFHTDCAQEVFGHRNRR